MPRPRQNCLPGTDLPRQRYDLYPGGREPAEKNGAVGIHVAFEGRSGDVCLPSDAVAIAWLKRVNESLIGDLLWFSFRDRIEYLASSRWIQAVCKYSRV